MTKQFLVYLLVGGIQYVMDIAIFSGLTLFISTEIANVTSRGTTALVGYWLNGKMTFKTEGRNRIHLMGFQRFLMVWLLMTLISTFLIGLMVSHYQLSWEVAIAVKLIVEVVLVVFNFLLQKRYVFV